MRNSEARSPLAPSLSHRTLWVSKGLGLQPVPRLRTRNIPRDVAPRRDKPINGLSHVPGSGLRLRHWSSPERLTRPMTEPLPLVSRRPQAIGPLGAIFPSPATRGTYRACKESPLVLSCASINGGFCPSRRRAGVSRSQAHYLTRRVGPCAAGVSRMSGAHD